MGKRFAFKINFFFWKAWKGRIPIDDNLARIGINLVSKWYCCERGTQETMRHLFLAATTAKELWTFFSRFAGIRMEGLQLQSLIKESWNIVEDSRLQ